jgi:hemoglobin
MTSGQPGSDSSAPSVQSTASGHNPHYAAIGADGVARLVERFYFHMDTLPEAAGIRALHPADLAPVREVLERYLTEWLGGPALYSSERGHPRLRRRHLRFRIGAAERDAWMLCMRAALGDVVSDSQLRAELDSSFFKVADFLRNDTEHVHQQHAARPPSE